MLTTVPGTYKNGTISLLEAPADITEARVFVTFLETGAAGPREAPQLRRSATTGLSVIDPGPNAAPITAEMVRAALVDFP